MSIRIKVIMPYFLLTLAVAIVGTYVVTRLVASSLSERLTNQLLEAGRVVSDGMARQEIKHLETARLVAYTRGVAEALSGGDAPAASALAEPVAAGLDTESLVLIDRQGQEILHLIRQADGSFQRIAVPSGISALAIVQDLLATGDPKAMPRRGIGQHPADGRYYYFTAIPVAAQFGMTGVVIVATSLDTLLPYLKSMALADVVFYGEQGQVLATTLVGQLSDGDGLAQLSIAPDAYQEALLASNMIGGENFTLQGRWYSLARSALKVGNERLGVFSTVLPLNFVLQAGSASRNTYVLIFAVAMAAVVTIGYGVSRLITVPLGQLVRTSQAITGGDLSQRTGLRSKDEIGVLAATFDEMTANLEARTAELQKTYHTLEQIDQAKSSFITLAAHELRTPLSLIKGYTEMLNQDNELDPDLATLAHGVLDGTKRMVEVVDGMLDISRIDSQTLEIAPALFNAGMLLERVRGEFARALELRSLSLNTQSLFELPPMVADPEQLYKVFYHLIMNAIKYTPDGGVITVTGRMVSDNVAAPEIEFAVQDTGIGIDPQHQEPIFEKFYQLGEVQFHSSGKTKFKGGGPGLGLSIARGVIRAHGGRIWVESPGRDDVHCPGSCFYVRIPFKAGPG
ncbi:MAG: ATP-binding protein [Chloroflexota bacterium]